MINGKGIYIWRGGFCGPLAGGKNPPQTAADACALMGLTWVMLKIGDATGEHSRSYPDMQAAVGAFRSVGISVWAWHYIYGGVQIDKAGNVLRNGATPEAEAEFAKRQVQTQGMDGYVIDAEREYQVADQHKRAKRFMGALEGIGAPVGLAGWRFPKLHPEYPWAEFLAGTELHMPQVYWNPPSFWRPSYGPEAETRTSVRDLLALKQIPILPTGRAYIGDGYANPKPEEETTFLRVAKELGCPGVSFWALDFLYLHPGGKERMAAISDYVWGTPLSPGGDSPPSTPQIGGNVQYRVTAFNLRVRSAPGMDARTIRWLWSGNKVTTLQVWDLGAMGVWAEVAVNEWAAISWKNRTYMVIV
jgi:hypothetical protein